MRYVIVSVVEGEGGMFNNNLRKEIFENLNIKSSKLPAHFTIKSPFEASNINELEKALELFSNSHNYTPYKLSGYDAFDNRVIFMKVLMSSEGKEVHDKLIDELSKIDYIDFNKKDGKDKIFHVTISSKKIQKLFDDLWNYVNKIPCDFDCNFNNISVYKWNNNTWELHKKYYLNKKSDKL